jgi:hypothetical protein
MPLTKIRQFAIAACNKKSIFKHFIIMNKIIKNPFERKHKGTVFARCIVCMLLAGYFYSCNDKDDQCPRRVYTRQDSFLADEQLKEYKPYIDVVNSMGVFWIESIHESAYLKYSTVTVGCSQLFNDLLLIDTRVSFTFYSGNDEDWKSIDDMPWLSFYEKDGFSFSVSTYYIPTGTQLPTAPKITPEEAIRTALRKESLEEFCQYELCYWKYHYNETPKLCWTLYGKRYYAYIDAINGEMISWWDPVSY